ncbi:hypothetical protein [Zhihengliuella sp.]|uniref:hypothetical protein n=1 Tax=Zhihengliuella sp. TaxID=1954483 RepID=UPI00281224AC|nr:hypothetical protein [Zhihengliuella sp.]
MERNRSSERPRRVRRRTRPSRGRLAVAGLALLTTAALTGCEVLPEVFPKAFPSTEASEAPPSVRATPAAEGEWKQVTTQAGDMSFAVRADWTVLPVPANQTSSTTGIPAYEVLDSEDRVLATLQQNPGRGTRTALPGSTFTPVDTVPAPDVTYLGAGDTAVVLDLTTHPNADSVLSYGLTNGTEVTTAVAPGGHVPLGGGVRGYPKLAGPLFFQGRADLGADDSPTRQEDALALAEQYVFTQEYADVVHMLQSLRYHPERATPAECDGAAFRFETVNVDCDSVLDIYHTARIAQEIDARTGSLVRVRDRWLCRLKELGAELDGLPPGYGIDGKCRLEDGYGTFTALWKE